jgi:hypothetical protein
MSKKKGSSIKKAATDAGEKRREVSRRALLAGMGLGAALPARLRGDEKQDFWAEFNKYWDEVKDDIAARDAEKKPKDKEILNLRIHYRRTEFLKGKSLPRSKC